MIVLYKAYVTRRQLKQQQTMIEVLLELSLYIKYKHLVHSQLTVNQMILKIIMMMQRKVHAYIKKYRAYIISILNV